MDEKPDQIIEHIEARRDELGRNLNELETKVRRSTDWRTYYDRNPMLIMGAALGGGLLLGAMVGGKTSRRSRVKTIRPYKPSTTSGISGKSPSSSYYTPTETSAQSFAGLGESTGAATGSASPSYGSASPGYGSGSPSYGTGTSYSGTGATSGSSTSEKSGRSGAAVVNKLSSLAGPQQVQQVHEAWDMIRGALIAFGISKAKEFLSQTVPGIQQHLEDHGRQPQHGESDRERSGFSGAGSYATGPSTSGQQSGSGTGATDYRSGSQNYSGGSTSYGTGSSVPGSGTPGASSQGGNTGPSSTANAGTSNSGRVSEADEYAGVTGSGSSPSKTPRSTP